MVADYKGFERMGHLEYLPLPGGSAAIKKPYRIAIGYVIKLLGQEMLNTKLDFLKKVDAVEIDLIKKQVDANLNSPLTSSMGRLFDAVSALLDIRGVIDYEAHAAIELETAAYEGINRAGDQVYAFTLGEFDGRSIIQLKELVSAIVYDLCQGVSKSKIAAKFHNTAAQMVYVMCSSIAKEKKINQVAISGGVFQNRLLLRRVISLLEPAGFKVLTHKQVPTNDGGVSLGQAVIANFS